MCVCVCESGYILFTFVWTREKIDVHRWHLPTMFTRAQSLYVLSCSFSCFTHCDAHHVRYGRAHYAVYLMTSEFHSTDSVILYILLRLRRPQRESPHARICGRSKLSFDDGNEKRNIYVAAEVNGSEDVAMKQN